MNIYPLREAIADYGIDEALQEIQSLLREGYLRNTEDPLYIFRLTSLLSNIEHELCELLPKRPSKEKSE